jgi:hypothetical protein
MDSHIQRIIARLHPDPEVQAHLVVLFGFFEMMSDNEFAWNWDTIAAVFHPVGTPDFYRVRDLMKSFVGAHMSGIYNGMLLNVMSLDKNPMTPESFPYVNFIYRQLPSTFTSSVSSSFSSRIRELFYHSPRSQTVDPDLFYLLGSIATIQALSLALIPCHREKSMFDMDVIFLGRVLERYSSAPSIPIDVPTTFVKYSSPFEPLVYYKCPSMEAERVFFKFMFAAVQVMTTHPRFIPQAAQTTSWVRFCFSHKSVRLTSTTATTHSTTAAGAATATASSVKAASF